MLARARVLLPLLLLVGVAGACGDDGDPPATTTSSVESTTSSTAATSSSTLDSTTTTAAPTRSTESTAGATGPQPVSELDAGSAGGSGEIRLDWSGVAEATGYRVYRADAPDGPFQLAADLDVASGDATRADGVTNVWSPARDEYQYIEYGEATRRYFRVVAYNSAGESAPSPTVCGSPTGQPDC